MASSQDEGTVEPRAIGMGENPGRRNSPGACLSSRFVARLPVEPNYLDRGARKPGRLVSGWNLVVSGKILERSWGET